jgi:hypothetical protein
MVCAEFMMTKIVSKSFLEAIEVKLSVYVWDDKIPTKNRFFPRTDLKLLEHLDDPAAIVAYSNYAYRKTDMDFIMVWKHENTYYTHNIHTWTNDDIILFRELRVKGMSVNNAIEFIEL